MKADRSLICDVAEIQPIIYLPQTMSLNSLVKYVDRTLTNQLYVIWQMANQVNAYRKKGIWALDLKANLVEK